MISALKDTKSYITTSMKAKEALVHKSAFSSPPKSDHNELVVMSEVTHQTIIKEIIYKVLMTQSTLKAPKLDKINSRILCMVWKQNSKRLIAIVYQSIRLGYLLKRQKKVCGILLRKVGKRDQSLLKSYRVISLLNCLGKVVEKIVAELLSKYYERFSKLHSRQMGAQ